MLEGASESGGNCGVALSKRKTLGRPQPLAALAVAARAARDAAGSAGRKRARRPLAEVLAASKPRPSYFAAPASRAVGRTSTPRSTATSPNPVPDYSGDGIVDMRDVMTHYRVRLDRARRLR